MSFVETNDRLHSWDRKDPTVVGHSRGAQWEPRVSVCLPVYNGAAYLDVVIGSVLSQSFRDLELVISDNASTDATEAICREAAATDHRVRYFRSEVNRGLAGNFNQAFQLSIGRYVMWIGHDDRLEADYVRCCLDALESDEGAVLAYANTDYIDQDGRRLRQTRLDNDGSSSDPCDRFERVVGYTHKCEAILGLMRRDALCRTKLHGPFADSDRVLLAEMALRGRFILVPKPLIGRREHPLQTTNQPDRWRRTLIFDPSKRDKLIFPFVREAVEFFGAVGRAPLTWRQRRRCSVHLLRWLYYHPQQLAKDMALAVEFVSKRHLSLERSRRVSSFAHRVLRVSVSESPHRE
jgi:glycosyltransferase involved in cell wall biosynthesis